MLEIRDPRRESLVEKLAQGERAGPLTLEETRLLADLSCRVACSGGADLETQVSKMLTKDAEGLSWLMLNLPRADSLDRGVVYSPITPRELSNLALFQERLVGIQLQTRSDESGSVLSLLPGQVWALRQFGETHPSDAPMTTLSVIKEGTKKVIKSGAYGQAPVTVGEPSEAFIPKGVRAAIADILRSKLGIVNPKFMAVLPSETDAKPELLYNYFPDGDTSSSPGHSFIGKIHPPCYRIAIVSRLSRALEAHMVPVRSSS